MKTMSSRSFLFFLLANAALVSGACGKISDDTPNKSAPPSPRPTATTEPPGLPPVVGDSFQAFARSTTADDSLSIVRVNLADGSLAYDHYTLPHPASAVRRAEAWSSDIVRFELN